MLERHVGVLIALLFSAQLSAIFARALSAFCIRMFGIEGINHRYFSHRSYKANQ